MKTSVKLRVFGWISILAVAINQTWTYAPSMREEASVIIGAVAIIGGILLKEIEALKEPK